MSRSKHSRGFSRDRDWRSKKEMRKKKRKAQERDIMNKCDYDSLPNKLKNSGRWDYF